MAKRSINRPTTSTINTQNEAKDDLVFTEQEVFEALKFDEFSIGGNKNNPFADYLKEKGKDDTLEGSVKDAFTKGEDENFSYGPVTDLLKTLLKHSKFAEPDFEIKDNTYMNNFLINYHSYYYPIPISLQEYTTACEITNTKDNPYESCNLSLTMPFELAKKIFSSDDGHPSPGGWLLIRNRYSKDGNNVTEDLTRTLKGFEINYEYEIRNKSPAIFFGVVSNISWNIFPDENGVFTCQINLLINSFIHNLIYGEFMVQENGVKENIDDVVKQGAYYGKTVDEIVKAQEANVLRAKPEIGAPSSLPFVFKQSDYLAFLSQQRAYLNGQNYDEVFGDPDFVGAPLPKDFKEIEEELQDTTQPNGVITVKRKAKLPMGYVLYNMIKKLTYMYLPVSILTEPMDTASFKDISARLFNSAGFKTVDEYGEGISEIENSLKLFILQGKKQGVSAEVLKLYVGGFMFLLGWATGENPIFVDPSNPNNPIFSYDELANLDASQKALVERTNKWNSTPSQPDEDPKINNRGYLAPTRNFSAKSDLDRIRKELNDLINSNPYEIVAPLRLGDILHVATTRNHVPVDYDLYAAMPWREIKDYEITKFINYYSGSQTIWGLLKATFQPDDEVFELFPTLIPMTDSMYKFKTKEERDNAYLKTQEKQQNYFGYYGPIRSDLKIGNPIWNLIGGIPTIVYRLKPTTPGHEINKSYIDAYNQNLIKENKALKKRPKMQYTPMTELISNVAIVKYEVYTGAKTKEDPNYPKRQGLETTTKKAFISEFKDNSYGMDNTFVWAEQYSKLDQDKISNYYDKIKDNAATTQYGKNYEDTYTQNQFKINKFLPPYINHNEIIQLSFNQSDALRINGVYLNSSKTKDVSSIIKYALMGKYVVEPESTFMHGLRKYENTYPFFYTTDEQFKDVKEKIDQSIDTLFKQGKSIDEISQDETLTKMFYQKTYANPAFGQTSKLSERFYMIMGDEQKYLSGSLRVIGNLISDEIKPGLWFEASIVNSSNDNKPMSENAIKDNLLFAYVDGVSTIWNVDQNTGNVVSESIISFSRGSFGRIMPNFPTVEIYRRNDAEILKDYINSEKLATKVTPVVEGGSFKGTKSTFKFNPFKNADLEEFQTINLNKERLQQLVKANLLKNKITKAEAEELINSDGIPKDQYNKLKSVYDTLTDQEKALVKSGIKGALGQ